MRALILHLQAPLMSFGGPQIDQIGPTGRFPTISQITGLFANAMGYAHGDFDRLDALQTRLSLASAQVREGDELEDYQTVDLGQSHLRHPAWTTRGRTEHREGGPEARYGTHIRFRRYRADASILSAVSLAPADAAPTLDAVANALAAPERPIFIGRRPCVPATPILVGIVEDAEHWADALAKVPAVFPKRWAEIVGDTSPRSMFAEWPIGDERALSSEERQAVHHVIDRRDWHNQLHGGERVVRRGPLALNEPGGQAAGAES